MDVLLGCAAGFVAWFILRYLVAGFYIIDQNQRAVITTFGRADRLGELTTLTLLSVLELRPMESLSSPQQQKHQKMRLPMTAAEEFERNSIDWYVPLPQSNSFVPSQRRRKAECYPVEPSADVRKMPNTQLAR